MIDFLPRVAGSGDLVRRVEWDDGEVDIEHDLRMRFDYARATPWTRAVDLDGGERALLAIAGPDGLIVTGPELHWPDEEEDTRTGCRADRLVGRFSLTAGEVLDWDMSWFPSYEDPPAHSDTDKALRSTIEFWERWSEGVIVTDSVPELVSRLRQYGDLGVDEIYLHHVAADQGPFLELAEEELLPALLRPGPPSST